MPLFKMSLTCFRRIIGLKLIINNLQYCRFQIGVLFHDDLSASSKDKLTSALHAHPRETSGYSKFFLVDLTLNLTG